MHVEPLTWADVLVQQMPQGKLAGLWQAFSCGIYGGQSSEHLSFVALFPWLVTIHSSQSAHGFPVYFHQSRCRDQRPPKLDHAGFGRPRE
jgi:hypothetical protein